MTPTRNTQPAITPIESDQPAAEAVITSGEIRAYLPIRIGGDPMSCPKDKCTGSLGIHKAGDTDLVCGVCKSVYTHEQIEEIRYRPIRELLERSAMHGLSHEEAICTPAMAYLLKSFGLTAICFPADKDPYKTDSYIRKPCRDTGCANYGGSLIITEDGDYKCNRCGKVYARAKILTPCPVCTELMLKRGMAGVEGNDYCPAGDCILPPGTVSKD